MHPQSKLTPPAVRLFYCVKIWGNAERAITKTVFILRGGGPKGIINTADYRQLIDRKFVNSLTVLVDLKTAKLMFKIKSNQLPHR